MKSLNIFFFFLLLFSEDEKLLKKKSHQILILVGRRDSVGFLKTTKKVLIIHCNSNRKARYSRFPEDGNTTKEEKILDYIGQLYKLKIIMSIEESEKTNKIW